MAAALRLWDDLLLEQPRDALALHWAHQWDHARGDSLGIKVTPTIFINNEPVDPEKKNPEGVRAAINAALAAKSKSGT